MKSPMYYFQKYVIGGHTGKREMAWFVFFIWCAGFGRVMYREAHNQPVASSAQIVEATAIPVLLVLLSVYGLEWAKDKFGESKKSTEIIEDLTEGFEE